ncbi:MAG: GTP-binding protein [Thermoplasmata archaeon]|nr:GTP-binding protein [Thermoplasmata archaeon]
MQTYVKKIALAGDWATGKTSLVKRFVYSQFDDKYVQTIGTKVSKRTVKFGSKEGEVVVNLIIWDVLGQKDYKMIHANAFRGLDGAILVVDITRKSTLQSIHDYWYPQIVKVSGRIPFVIFGNKSDLKQNAEVTIEEIKGAAAAIGVPEELCMLTSAKTGENVEKAFIRIARACVTTPPPLRVTQDSGGIYKTPEVYTAQAVLDAIIIDFVEIYGNDTEAMEVVEKCARAAGVNMQAPEKQALQEFVVMLKKIENEKGHAPEFVEENFARRLMMIAYI